MIEITASQGSVYQDLEFANAHDMQTKSGLVIKLASSIETRKISKAEAAQSLEVSLEKLDDILRGRFCDVPASSLMRYVNQL